MNSLSTNNFNNDDPCVKHNVKENKIILKCSTPSNKAIMMPIPWWPPKGITVSSLSLNAKKFNNPHVKLTFTSNIILTSYYYGGGSAKLAPGSNPTSGSDPSKAPAAVPPPKPGDIGAPPAGAKADGYYYFPHLTLKFQIFRVCSGLKLAVGPEFTFSRPSYPELCTSDAFTFFVCDFDACFDGCCTYIAEVKPVESCFWGTVDVNNATLSAIVTDGPGC